MNPNDKAMHAKAILENPIYKPIMSALIDASIQAIIATQPGETEERELQYRNIRAAQYFDAALTKLLSDVKIDENQASKVKRNKKANG